jgi:two-component system sensor histidine kinase GlrK
MRSLPLLPRNFATWLLAAFVLVLLPLAAALGLAVIQLNNFTIESSVANARALEHGAQARAASEALVGVERALRQAQVLGGPALRDAYRGQRDRLLAALTGLSAHASPDSTLLEDARAAEQRVADAMDEGRPLLALVEFDTLQDRAAALIDAAARQRAEDEARLAARPERVTRTLLALAGAALPLAIVLALLFAWALGRPVRKLGDAMRRLGEGDLETPVVVRGPQDIARLGDRLEWLRARLSTLEQTRSRFLRSMSHDLKTPIAAIAEGAASLDEQLYGPLTASQRSVVGVIRHNTERLLARIESLLRGDRALPDATGSIPQAQPAAVARVDLAQVLRAVLQDHELALRHRRLQLRESIDGPAPVVGDADGLRVVIDNLVSNAIKFSPPGGAIDVRLQCDATAAEQDVQVIVTDEGPGVAPGEEERIFDPAVRGSAALASGAPGSGHGLAIARDIAQAHGGRLRVQEPGRKGGAQFELRLPRLLEVDEHAVA